MDIIFTNKLKDIHKLQVIRLFYETFKLKIKYIWLYNKNDDDVINLLSVSMNQENGIYALKNDEIIGFAGLSYNKKMFINLSYQNMLKSFGTFGGTWRYLYNIIFEKFSLKPNQNEAKIEYLAVASTAQGLGIGSQLLDMVFTKFKEQHKQKIYLEVVDTNNKAEKLYQKLGFKTIKIDNVAFISKRAGFNKVIYMSKTLSNSKM